MNEFVVYFEDGTKKVDPNFKSYNPGTQLMLDILDEQDFKFYSYEIYESTVKKLEECRCQEDVETIMYNMGTDYINELEVHKIWMDVMFPRPEKSPHLDYDN